MIITIGRQCGCNGDEIGRKLAEKLNLPFYDRKYLVQKAEEKGILDASPNFFAENPVNSLLYAIASGDGTYNPLDEPKKIYSTVIEDGNGVIIGRCGNTAFENDSNVVKVFLCGDFDKRVDTIAKSHNLEDRRKAEKLVNEYDDRRASFHKFYTGKAWGAAQYYDLCLNVSSVGEDKAIDMIMELVELKAGK